MPKKSKLYVGIDPGKSGGIVGLTTGGPHKLIFMPTTEKDMWDTVAELASRYTCQALIEKVNSYGQGRASAFTFGRNYQMIRQSFIGNKIPLIERTPQSWMKELQIPTGGKLSPKEKKEKLRAHAQLLFPENELWDCGKGKQMQLCDAMLIGLACRKIILGR